MVGSLNLSGKYDFKEPLGMSGYHEEYRRKLTTPEKAVQRIKNGAMLNRWLAISSVARVVSLISFEECMLHVEACR